MVLLKLCNTIASFKCCVLVQIVSRNILIQLHGDYTRNVLILFCLFVCFGPDPDPVLHYCADIEITNIPSYQKDWRGQLIMSPKITNIISLWTLQIWGHCSSGGRAGCIIIGRLLVWILASSSCMSTWHWTPKLLLMCWSAATADSIWM